MLDLVSLVLRSRRLQRANMQPADNLTPLLLIFLDKGLACSSTFFYKFFFFKEHCFAERYACSVIVYWTWTTCWVVGTLAIDPLFLVILLVDITSSEFECFKLWSLRYVPYIAAGTHGHHQDTCCVGKSFVPPKALNHVPFLSLSQSIRNIPHGRPSPMAVHFPCKVRKGKVIHFSELARRALLCWSNYVEVPWRFFCWSQVTECRMQLWKLRHRIIFTGLVLDI